MHRNGRSHTNIHAPHGTEVGDLNEDVTHSDDVIRDTIAFLSDDDARWLGKIPIKSVNRGRSGNIVL